MGQNISGAEVCMTRFPHCSSEIFLFKCSFFSLVSVMDAYQRWGVYCVFVFNNSLGCNKNKASF